MFKPKIIGIGGIFFKAKKPSSLKKWYKDHLSFNLNPYGSSFEFRNANDPNKVQYFLWSVFKNNTDYFSPSKKDFMINYRVEDIEKTVMYLRNIGTKMLMKSQRTLMESLYIYLILRGMLLSFGRLMMTFYAI